jgi:transcriptional regulator with XRE-family HTH domain
MANKVQYTSVSELVQDLVPDVENRAAIENRIAGRKLVKQLMARRAVKGLSQQEIAQKIGCTQSRISKLESSSDDDIRLGDLRVYAKAVDCEFVYGLAPHDMKPVDKVKCHVFAIKKHMDDLASLARADETIIKGVANFFSELFFNFARLFGDSVKRLPHGPDDTPYLDFKFAEICPCQQDIQDTSRVDRDDRALCITP